MDAEPAVLHRLLDLQQEDTAIKRLSDRRAALPEAARLADVNAQLAELESDLEIARKQEQEAAREQSRLEGEIELLDQKTQREEQRMFSGAVSNPKELSSLQSEVEMLKRKRSELEDALLEVMVQKDKVSSMVLTLEKEVADTTVTRDELATQVQALTTEIDSELASRNAQRTELASGIPEDVLSLYERIRVAKGGVGAARLEQGTCQGCHTTVPAKEQERIRSQGGLQRCDNCRRILVLV